MSLQHNGKLSRIAAVFELNLKKKYSSKLFEKLDPINFYVRKKKLQIVDKVFVENDIESVLRGACVIPAANWIITTLKCAGPREKRMYSTQL